MGGIHYDIYISSQTAANPIYDERWDPKDIFGDFPKLDTTTGKVHIWTIEDRYNAMIDAATGKPATSVTNFENALRNSGITNKSKPETITPIIQSKAKEFFSDFGVAPRTSYYTYDVGRKGLYFSLKDISGVTDGKPGMGYLRILKFDADVVSDPPKPETSDDPEDWKWWGSGVGLNVHMSAGLEETYLGSTYNALYNRFNTRNLLLKAKNWDDVTVYLLPVRTANSRYNANGSITHTLGWSLYIDAPKASNSVRAEPEIYWDSAEDSYKGDGSYGFTNHYGGNTHDRQSSQVRNYIDPKTGQQRTISYTGVVFGSPNNTAFWTGTWVSGSIQPGYYSPALNADDRTKNVYEMATGAYFFNMDVYAPSWFKVISLDALPVGYTEWGGTLDWFKAYMEQLGPEDIPFEDEEEDVPEEAQYQGDLCAWYISPDQSVILDTWTSDTLRIYHSTKITDYTDDTIKLHFMDDGDNPPEVADDYYSDVDPGDPTDPGDIPANSGSGYLTTTYSLGHQSFRQFAQWVWSDGYKPFWDNYSPLENIVSLISLPFNITGGSTNNIVLGASDSGIQATAHSQTVQKIHEHSLSLERVFNNFFDFEPYTSLSLYIPFVGFRSLVPSEVIGNTIKLVYYVDIANGDMIVNVFVIRDGIQQLIDTYSANVGVSLPLTASNAAEKLNGLVQGAVSMGVSAMSGNAAGVIGSALDLASSQSDHYRTSGSLGGASAWSAPMKPFVLASRPNYTIPAGYAKQHGFRCEKTLYLSQCSGFTVVRDAQLDGLQCTDAEAKQIDALLKEGVYI